MSVLVSEGTGIVSETTGLACSMAGRGHDTAEIDLLRHANCLTDTLIQTRTPDRGRWQLNPRVRGPLTCAARAPVSVLLGIRPPPS